MQFNILQSLEGRADEKAYYLSLAPAQQVVYARAVYTATGLLPSWVTADPGVTA